MATVLIIDDEEPVRAQSIPILVEKSEAAPRPHVVYLFLVSRLYRFVLLRIASDTNLLLQKTIFNSKSHEYTNQNGQSLVGMRIADLFIMGCTL